MRYVILKNEVDIKEICSRQEYLYDVIKVYTIPLYKNGIVELKSFPENVFDVLFIFGHNNQVFSYLVYFLVSYPNLNFFCLYFLGIFVMRNI